VTAFISGGCKNGKSSFAEALACKLRKSDAPLYYLATMVPTDHEDETRIKRHQEARAGMGFTTIEAGRDVLSVLVPSMDYSGTLLLDSTTALLANEMFAADPEGQIQYSAHVKVADDVVQLMDRFDSIVIVSDYIYSDAFLYDDLTEAYRRGLAYIDRKLAKHCNVVVEVCLGQRIIHKGRLP